MSNEDVAIQIAYDYRRKNALVEKIQQALDEAEERGRGHGRGRFTKCRGCPTVQCTCFTDLEEELLNKTTTPEAAGNEGK